MVISQEVNIILNLKIIIFKQYFISHKSSCSCKLPQPKGHLIKRSWVIFSHRTPRWYTQPQNTVLRSH